MSKQLLAVVGAALLVTVAGCAKDSVDHQPVQVGVSSTGSIHEKFYVASSTLWANPGNIPVCWEQSGLTQQKAWIKDAVTKAWTGNDSAIKFTGWGQCTTGAPGIHVVSRLDEEAGPHVVDIGNTIDGMDEGMVLDMDMENELFQNCHTSTQMMEQCNRGVAVHEFGHALGFLHEQERTDTPNSCPDKNPVDPQDGDKTIGKWDLMSIMNYCFPDRLEVYPDSLSPLDKAGLIQMYPPPKVTTPAPASDDADDDDSTGPSTQSKDDSADADDDDDRSDADADDDDDDKPSSSKKKKSSSSKAAAPVASSGCSAAPNRTSSSSSNLSWLFGFGLVLAARKRRQVG